MSETENKIAVRRFFEQVWNQGEVSRAGEFLSDDFVSHNTLDVTVRGADEYARSAAAYRAAFTDFSVTLEDVFAEGDRVAVRGTDRGTQVGEFMGRPASGGQVTATWIEIFRMAGDKAVEGWIEFDSRRLLDQLDSGPVG